MNLRLPAVLVLLASTIARADTVRVAAAISLKDALADVAKAYESTIGDHVEFTLGASGQLLSQIRSGADVDVFVSAAAQQIDELTGDKLADPATRRDVVGNELVLIVPADATSPPKDFAAIATDAVVKIAVGEPKTVPAGAYAAEVFATMKLDVAAKLVYGTNVRQVLAYVERGEVSAGLVYTTDAMQSGDKVKIVATAPADSHSPIVYPSVLLANAKHRASGTRFLTYLTSPAAQVRFAARGFTPPPIATTQPAAK